MKKVLLIPRAKTERTLELADIFAGNVRQLLEDDLIVENCEISELFFELDSESIAIYHPKKRFDIRDFDLVIFRHIGSYAVEAHAITAYCEYFNISYTDTYLNRLLPDNKLSSEFASWFGGVMNWPRTFYGPVEEMERRFAELGERAVLKDNFGSKGRLNFVVSSPEQIRSIVEQYSDVFFLLQEFIPNDGDLRVLVMADKPVLAIRRVGDGSSHLNNTSQGGIAEVVPLDQIGEDILAMARRSAEVLQIQVAGVDVMINSQTGVSYLLEVNNGPQISSGSFVEEKTALYADMIRLILRRQTSV